MHEIQKGTFSEMIEEIKKLMLEDPELFDEDQFKNGYVRILPHETWWDKNAVCIKGKVGFWNFAHVLIEKGYYISNIYPDGKDRIVWIVTSKPEPKK